MNYTNNTNNMNNININNLFSVTNTNKELDVHSLYHTNENIVKNNTIDFNIDNLINERAEKKQKVIEQYKKLFHICLKKIKMANKLNKTDIIYDIPDAIYMYPDYSIHDCMEYINSRLHKLYMETCILSYKSIFITWINIEYNKKQLIKNN